MNRAVAATVLPRETRTSFIRYLHRTDEDVVRRADTQGMYNRARCGNAVSSRASRPSEQNCGPPNLAFVATLFVGARLVHHRRDVCRGTRGDRIALLVREVAVHRTSQYKRT